MPAVLALRNTVHAYVVTDAVQLEIKPTIFQTKEPDEPQYSPTGMTEVEGRQKKAEKNDDRAPQTKDLHREK